MKLFLAIVDYATGIVTPFAGVWIEITFVDFLLRGIYVTPFAGVWIEISEVYEEFLKYKVTPFAGVWIEIYGGGKSNIVQIIVTPFAGVWIEILKAAGQMASA